MNETVYISFYLRDNRIRIFCKTVRTIGEPRFVRFLINGDATSMIMAPYDKMELQSIRVPLGIYNMAGRMEFRSTRLCQLLSRRLGWDTMHSYRIPGRILIKQGVVAFDLSSAIPINAEADET